MLFKVLQSQNRNSLSWKECEQLSLPATQISHRDEAEATLPGSTRHLDDSLLSPTLDGNSRNPSNLVVATVKQ